MIDRRQFLQRCGGGLGGIALQSMLLRERRVLHHAPRATRVVQLFMSGAASQVDTFDHKPELERRHGRPFDVGQKVELFQSSPGTWMRSPWRFRPRGECGKQVSDLVPHIAQCVDDIAFVHSMTSRSNVHGPATFLQATGFVQPGFPSMGAWIAYGLGAACDDLPTFVVLPDARGFGPGGPGNWSAGFLPAANQGTVIRPGRAEAIHDLFAPSGFAWLDDGAERDARALLRTQNEAHAARHPGDDRLDARIRAYEMAARLQVAAPEVLDLRGESAATRALYGIDDEVTRDFGMRCLLTRRLLERGVRFVQVWSGADNGFPRRNWDSHEDLPRDHAMMAAEMDRPTAALLMDLKQRGLLDDTIVLWTTEFGRMPCAQGGVGRDHNPFGFTNWLAGGGIRGGVSFGATDEFSFRAIQQPTEVYDVHATVLWQLGIDHEKLTVRHDGIDRRLTDVKGRVLREILA
ncbi:MAG: DUF1501 domain-containing protein [Planctomycetota bacterium]